MRCHLWYIHVILLSPSFIFILYVKRKLSINILTSSFSKYLHFEAWFSNIFNSSLDPGVWDVSACYVLCACVTPTPLISLHTVSPVKLQAHISHLYSHHATLSQVPTLSSWQIYLRSLLGPYAERIDLWFEPFFVKEIRRVIEWLQEIKTAYQYCYKFLLIQQNKFFRLNVN
jgi:hypothetical protein